MRTRDLENQSKRNLESFDLVFDSNSGFSHEKEITTEAGLKLKVELNLVNDMHGDRHIHVKVGDSQELLVRLDSVNTANSTHVSLEEGGDLIQAVTLSVAWHLDNKVTSEIEMKENNKLYGFNLSSSDLKEERIKNEDHILSMKITLTPFLTLLGMFAEKNFNRI